MKKPAILANNQPAPTGVALQRLVRRVSETPTAHLSWKGKTLMQMWMIEDAEWTSPEFGGHWHHKNKTEWRPVGKDA